VSPNVDKITKRVKLDFCHNRPLKAYPSAEGRLSRIGWTTEAGFSMAAW